MLTSIVLAILMAHPFVTAPGQAGAAHTQCLAQTGVLKPWPPAGVVRPGAGVTSPRVLRDVKPGYTAAAMDAKIQGRVGMEAVVEADGTVGEVCVTQSLDREYGLDDEAVRSLKQWRFEAGKKDGVPIPVLIDVEMTFVVKSQR